LLPDIPAHQQGFFSNPKSRVIVAAGTLPDHATGVVYGFA